MEWNSFWNFPHGKNKFLNNLFSKQAIWAYSCILRVIEGNEFGKLSKVKQSKVVFREHFSFSSAPGWDGGNLTLLEQQYRKEGTDFSAQIFSLFYYQHPNLLHFSQPCSKISPTFIFYSSFLIYRMEKYLVRHGYQVRKAKQ